jgi:hypothetical protein
MFKKLKSHDDYLHISTISSSSSRYGKRCQMLKTYRVMFTKKVSSKPGTFLITPSTVSNKWDMFAA